MTEYQQADTVVAGLFDCLLFLTGIAKPLVNFGWNASKVND